MALEKKRIKVSPKGGERVERRKDSADRRRLRSELMEMSADMSLASVLSASSSIMPRGVVTRDPRPQPLRGELAPDIWRGVVPPESTEGKVVLTLQLLLPDMGGDDRFSISRLLPHALCAHAATRLTTPDGAPAGNTPHPGHPEDSGSDYCSILVST